MQSTHRTYGSGQTIAAIATPPGEGGIAVVRISGRDALAVADRIFSGSILDYKTHTIHLGEIVDFDNRTIDRALALIFRAPHSYTGEDTVEFHCHGGRWIPRKVLGSALAAGAHIALPGEFTYRAFQNGKIDLTRAEAVQQVIASKGELAWRAAGKQLAGKLWEKIRAFQEQLTDIAATLEAAIDFPEEGLDAPSMVDLAARLSHVLSEMRCLHEGFHRGRALSTEFSFCLVGAPNAGKSSLMNALLGRDRAIVTDFPGTTRDLLEESIDLNGVSLRLIDTAGMREAEGVVEREGVRRAQNAMQDADCLLFVIDVTQPIYQSLPEKGLVVWNKIDLPHRTIPPLASPHQICVSAKTGEGVEELKGKMRTLLWDGELPSKEEVILTSERHFQALGRSIEALERLSGGLRDLPFEFLASDLQIALRELGTIIGIDVREEVLSAIFAKFCIGK